MVVGHLENLNDVGCRSRAGASASVRKRSKSSGRAWSPAESFEGNNAVGNLPRAL